MHSLESWYVNQPYHLIQNVFVWEISFNLKRFTGLWIEPRSFLFIFSCLTPRQQWRHHEIITFLWKTVKLKIPKLKFQMSSNCCNLRADSLVYCYLTKRENLFQESLNSFLMAAEELAVKGLSGQTGNSSGEPSDFEGDVSRYCWCLIRLWTHLTITKLEFKKLVEKIREIIIILSGLDVFLSKFPCPASIKFRRSQCLVETNFVSPLNVPNLFGL